MSCGSCHCIADSREFATPVHHRTSTSSVERNAYVIGAGETGFPVISTPDIYNEADGDGDDDAAAAVTASLQQSNEGIQCNHIHTEVARCESGLNVAAPATLTVAVEGHVVDEPPGANYIDTSTMEIDAEEAVLIPKQQEEEEEEERTIIRPNSLHSSNNNSPLLASVGNHTSTQSRNIAHGSRDSLSQQHANKPTVQLISESNKSCKNV